MLLQAVNHSFQSLWWRDYELALAGNRTQTLILLSKLRALSCSGTLGNKIVSTCLAYWFSQRFFCLLVALYVFKCLSFEPNLINYLKTLLNLFLVFFSSIFCHEVTDIDENMSVNSHVISSKYTHAHNIHLYPCILILKSKVVHSVLLIVSGLLMVLKWNRFMCGTKKKKISFSGRCWPCVWKSWSRESWLWWECADHGWCRYLYCRYDESASQRAWTEKLSTLTQWLQTRERPQCMAYLT